MEEAHQHAAPTKSRPLTTGYFFCGVLQTISFTPTTSESFVLCGRELTQALRHSLGSASTNTAWNWCMQGYECCFDILRYAKKNFMIWWIRCEKNVISVSLLTETLLRFESWTIIFDDPYISYTSLRGFTHASVNIYVRIIVNHKFY